MAKRFTATEKWEDAWFGTLPMEYKLLWLYMLDTCNHAGIWEVNLRKAAFCTGCQYDEAEALEVIGKKVRQVGEDKWWIVNFIRHQYKCDISELNPNNLAHKGVIAILKQHGIEAPTKPLQSPIGGAKDKDKDKEKDKENLYGENVILTPEEFVNLCERLKSESRARKAIEILDNYKGSSGKKYKSDYRAILNWVIPELEKRESQQVKTGFAPAPIVRRSTYHCPKCDTDHPVTQDCPKAVPSMSLVDHLAKKVQP
jgi:hypothetical protein